MCVINGRAEQTIAFSATAKRKTISVHPLEVVAFRVEERSSVSWPVPAVRARRLAAGRTIAFLQHFFTSSVHFHSWGAGERRLWPVPVARQNNHETKTLWGGLSLSKSFPPREQSPFLNLSYGVCLRRVLKQSHMEENVDDDRSVDSGWPCCYVA